MGSQVQATISGGHALTTYLYREQSGWQGLYISPGATILGESWAPEWWGAVSPGCDSEGPAWGALPSSGRCRNCISSRP